MLSHRNRIYHSLDCIDHLPQVETQSSIETQSLIQSLSRPSCWRPSPMLLSSLEEVSDGNERESWVGGDESSALESSPSVLEESERSWRPEDDSELSSRRKADEEPSSSSLSPSSPLRLLLLSAPSPVAFCTAFLIALRFTRLGIRSSINSRMGPKNSAIFTCV